MVYEIEVQMRRMEAGAAELVKAVAKAREGVEKALAGEGELPAGCPDKEAYARYLLRGISPAMSEVSGAFKEMDEMLEGEEE